MTEDRPDRWALEALGAELMRIEPTADRAARPYVRPEARPLALAACVALIAFVAFTPPGRAFAEDLAGLVGIGDEPSTDHATGAAPIVASEDQVVLATGTTPSGQAYEISAFTGQRSASDQAALERRFRDIPGDPEDRAAAQVLEQRFGTCFEIDYPDSPHPYGTSSCTRGGVQIPFGTPGFNEAPHASPESAIQAEGMTGPTVARVEVTYVAADGQRVQAPVAFGRLTDELAARIGAPNPMGSYVAFLPADNFPDFDAPALRSLQLTAYDADGNVVKDFAYASTYDRLKERRFELACVERRFNSAADGEPTVSLGAIRRQCAASLADR